MPGTFTHLMICEAGMYQDDILGEELAKFLSGRFQFVFLGAESPDLPYLSLGVGGNQWADAMHYQRTNSLVISGFEALRQIWGVRTPADEIKCAWLLGYVSHMVADATIHPIVNAVVGTPYAEHKEAHRLCEMAMDSLIFEEINHSNLTYAELSQALEFCKKSPHFQELLDFWQAQLASNYPAMDHEPEPLTWFTEYTEALDAAEGGKVAAIFRHLGVGGNYFYRNPEEIRTDTPEDYQKYYAEVEFPGGRGPFRTHGFDRAVTNVVNVWKTLYDGLLSSPGPNISQVVKNWNLDTGGDQDAGGIVTLWEYSETRVTWTDKDLKQDVGKPPPSKIHKKTDYTREEVRQDSESTKNRIRKIKTKARRKPQPLTQPDQEVKVVPGPSTHITTDMWTLKDSLGYRAYAKAIADFIQHPLTRPPLTISIQAPWGGGKTSMMRMIQEYLDPAGVTGYIAEAGGRRQVVEEAKKEQGETGDSTITKGDLEERETRETEKSGHINASREKLLTVGQVLAEVQAWWQKSLEKTLPLPLVPSAKKKKILTVWFNAWKYESTNQVWAGLAHAIMDQVTQRLSPLDRERFWLRLNLKRLDYDKIRKEVYSKVWAGCWEKVTGWLHWLVAGLGFSFLAFLSGWQILGWLGSGFSIAMGYRTVRKNYIETEDKENKKPAAMNLGDFLQIPNYGAEMGFVHQAETDLKRFLGLLKEEDICLVVFVDDLDRCSPVKVAQVVEAVNLFLAGDFPESIFIMGMDTEMVAAALQAHHKEVIACLPEDAGIPVGWRFMDKFVQLPFLIPPPEDEEVGNYLTALLSKTHSETENLEIQEAVKQMADNVKSLEDLEKKETEIEQRGGIKAETIKEAAKQVKWAMVSREIDKSISEFTDNPEILSVISEGKEYFRGNPRELKRFVNAYRFQYCLWSVREKQKLPVPNLKQLLRWTVFSIKWPEVVRWCRQSGGTEWEVKEDTPGSGKKPVITMRLKLLEKISGQANNLKSWQELAQKELNLNPEKMAWLHDDDLLQFLYNENDFLEGQRLSDGAGKGLW